MRQNEVHQQQDQQQRADHQRDATQIAVHVRVLSAVGRKRQCGCARSAARRGLGLVDGPRGALGRRLDGLGRLFAVREFELVWLEGSFRRSEPVPTFRRWPAALAVARAAIRR